MENEEQVTLEKSNKVQFVLFVILAVVAVAAIGVVYYQNLQLKKELAMQNSPKTVVSPIPKITGDTKPSTALKPESYTENTTIANQKRYVSPKLGISFLYLSAYGGEIFNVKEVENKIYVYTNLGSGDYKEGQYVEVFPKEKTSSLAEALKSRFLKGYSAEDCKVTGEYLTADRTGDAKPKYPATYETGNIMVAAAFTDVEALFEQLKKCPSPYTQSNGISYFLADSTHPDKFLFLSIGQYAIMADEKNNQAWQDTIKFLD